MERRLAAARALRNRNRPLNPAAFNAPAASAAMSADTTAVAAVGATALTPNPELGSVGPSAQTPVAAQTPPPQTHPLAQTPLPEVGSAEVLSDPGVAVGKGAGPLGHESSGNVGSSSGFPSSSSQQAGPALATMV